MTPGNLAPGVLPLARTPPLITRAQLARSLIIACVVGTWLTLLNQYDRILAGAFDLVLVVRIALNFATPLTVSFVTAIWNNVGLGRLRRPSADR